MSRDYAQTRRPADAGPAEELEAPTPEPAAATPRAMPVAGVARTVPGRISRRGGPAGDPLGGTAAAPEVVDALQRRRGAGSPLPEQVAQRFGEQLGTDLSGVRVHTDAEADRVSRSVGAQAFTHGSDIYFTSGSYNPSGGSGQHLLAHELTHVAQNATGQFRGSGTGTEIGRADDPAEQHAERTATRVVSALQRSTAAAPAGESDVAAGAPVADGALRRLTVKELVAMHESFIAGAGGGKRSGKKGLRTQKPEVAEEKAEAETEQETEQETEAKTEAEEKVEGGTEEKVEDKTEEKVEGGTEEKVEDETEEKVEGGTEEKVEDETEEKVEDETEEDEKKLDEEVGTEDKGPDDADEELESVIGEAEDEKKEEGGGGADKNWLAAAAQPDFKAEANSAQEKLAALIPPHLERIKTYWALMQKVDSLPANDSDDWGKAAAKLGHEIRDEVRTAGKKPGGGFLGEEFAAELAALSLPGDFPVLVKKLMNEHWKCVEFLKRQDFPVHNDGSMDMSKSESGEYNFSGRTIKVLSTDEDRDAFKVAIRNGSMYRSSAYGSDESEEKDEGKKSAPAVSGPKLADTGKGVTQAEGLGWEMFVVSRTGEWYVASQKLGLTEHGSLLGSNDVAMGGELKARNGRITELTNRSGAYLADYEQVVDVLVSLNSRGMDMNFPVSGYKGIDQGLTGKQVLEKAGVLGKVNPQETYNVISGIDEWEPLIQQFGRTRILQVIAAEGWRPEGDKGVLDAKRTKLSLQAARAKLQMDPKDAVAQVSQVAAMATLATEFGERRLLEIVGAKGWHVEGGTVFDKKGEKVSLNDAREKLTVDENIRYAEIKKLGAWAAVFSEFKSDKSQIVELIRAKGWRVEGGAVVNRKGETVTPDELRRKLQGEDKASGPEPDLVGVS